MPDVPDVGGNVPAEEYATIAQFVKDVAAVRRTLDADGVASRDQLLALLDPLGGRRVKVAGLLVEMVGRGELVMGWDSELRDYVFTYALRPA